MASSQSNVCIALCTCPDEQTASRLAGGLVEERLAACVNILPKVRSVFRWEGKVEDEPEVLMIIKSTEERAAPLEAWLRDNHPYDVPEILVLPIGGGSRSYLQWVIEETS